MLSHAVHHRAAYAVQGKPHGFAAAVCEFLDFIPEVFLLDLLVGDDYIRAEAFQVLLHFFHAAIPFSDDVDALVAPQLP